jgi:E2/UBC family protein D
MMRLKIDMSEQGITVQHEGPNGDVVVKAVDAQDLSRAFAGEVIMDTGWLGPRIHRFSQMGGVTRLLVEEPPKRRTIKYEGGTPVKNVPTPRALFNFSLRNGQLEGSRMCVSMETVPPGMEWIPTDNSPIARWPMMNVFDDTRICWGRLVIPVLSIQTISVLINLFFDSKFNHDLAHVGAARSWRGDPPPTGIELLRRLAREETFPMDLLCPMGNLGSWWRGERFHDR